MMNSGAYRTITGRPIDLGNISVVERQLLLEIEAKYRTGPEWTEFGDWCMHHLRRAKLSDESVVHRICQDLEARLGIVQGKAGPPDYRDYLVDLIETQFGSRYKFCAATGIDQSQLSRILSGTADLSIPALQKILQQLGATLVIEPDTIFKTRLASEQVDQALQAIVAR